MQTPASSSAVGSAVGLPANFILAIINRVHAPTPEPPVGRVAPGPRGPLGADPVPVLEGPQGAALTPEGATKHGVEHFTG